VLALTARAPQDDGLVEWKGHEGGVTSLARSEDGLWVASGGLDGTVRLWDADGGGDMGVFREHEDEVYAVAFSPDGQWLASAGYDRRVVVRGVPEGELVQEFADLPTWCLSVGFSPDGERLAAGGADGVTRIWEVESGEVVTEVPGRGTVEAVAWDPEGRWLALGGVGVRLVDAESGRPARTWSEHKQKVAALAWSPSGELLASASWDGTARVWDAESGDVVHVFECEAPVWAYVGLAEGATPPEARMRLPLTCVAWSGDGERLATGGAGRVVWVWDVATGEVERLVSGFPRSVTGLAFGEDGARVIAACLDGVVRATR